MRAATVGAILALLGVTAAPIHAERSGDVDALLLSGDYESAETLARLSLADVERNDARALVRAQAAVARALAANGHLSSGEADRVATEAVDLARARLGEHDPEYASSVAALGLVELRSGRFGAAEGTLALALKLLCRAGRDCVGRRIDTLALLAEADAALEHFDAALAAVDEGLAEAVSLPESAVLLARLLDRRAWALLYKGRVAEGHAAAEAAVKARAPLDRPHPDAVWSALELGDADNMAGRLEESAEHNREGLELARLTLREGHPLAALAASRLASREADAGAFADAFDRHREALAATRSSLGEQHPQVADQLIDFGNAYYQAGDPTAAAGLYEKALSLARRTRGPDSLPVATLEYNLAFVRADAGEMDRAEASLGHALAIWRAMHGDEHPHIALALAEWADLLARLGRDREARGYYERALALRLRLPGEEHPLVAGIRAGLAEVLARLGERAEAEAQAARASAGLSNRGGWRDRLTSDVMALRARLALARGDWREASKLAEDSASLSREHVLHVVRFLGERQALSYVGRGFAGRDALLSIAAQPGADESAKRAAFDALIASRHLVLDEIAARVADARRSDALAAGPWKRFVLARERLATLVYRGVASEGTEGSRLLREAEDQADDLERAAAIAGAQRREEVETPVTWESLEPHLPAGTVLVSFVRYDRIDTTQRGEGVPLKSTRCYLAFVARPGSLTPIAVPLGSATEIDTLLLHWRQRLEHTIFGDPPDPARASEREPDRMLASRVWAPIAGHVSGARRVLLVPDGSLQLLNFAALPVAHGRYLIESGPTLHVLSAERDLRAVASSPVRARSLLVVAEPAFDRIEALRSPTTTAERLADSRTRVATTGHGAGLRGRRWGCGHADMLHWDPLPSAGLEARDIEGLWAQLAKGEVRLLAGSSATERAVKAAAPAFDVLHIASHGFQLGPDCGAEALDGDHQAAGKPALQASPLSQAGLPLAGANQRRFARPEDDDGILTAEEVAGLDLRRVRWVVLSACDTGRGQVQDAEGVLGLRRAFAVAGAHTVIMSLWPVDDQNTRYFMRELYEARLGRGLDTAESIRDASLTLLRRLRAEGGGRAEPAFWAAFVAAGDWR